MSDVTPSSASDIEKAGVKEAHHEHVEVHSEQNTALRIDGDDEDHMHEPPVRLPQNVTQSLLELTFHAR